MSVFGTIRHLIHEAPANLYSWLALCSHLANITQPGEVDALMPYLSHHISRWPAHLRIVPPTWQNRLLKQIEQPWLALCQTLVHTHLDAQSALMLLNHPQLTHITYLRPCHIRNSVDSSYTQCLKLNTIKRLHGLRCDGASKFERTLQDERLSDLRMLRLSSHHQTNQIFTTPSPWHQSIQVLHLDRARFLPLDELIVLDLPQLTALMAKA